MRKSLPSYAKVTKALENIQSDLHAAQIHGLLCGLLCASSEITGSWWDTCMLGENRNEEAQAILLQLYEESFRLLDLFSLEFKLLLPSDKTNINDRTEALGLWCQGFITSLKQAAIPQKNITPDATEAIQDILEIAQVNYGDLANTEENESAYYELVEYIRMAVLMIYSEIKSPSTSTPPTTTKNKSFH